MSNDKKRDRISEAFEDKELITRALAIGVRDSLIKHKQDGNPIVVYRDGAITWIPPEEIVIPEIN